MKEKIVIIKYNGIELTTNEKRNIIDEIRHIHNDEFMKIYHIKLLSIKRKKKEIIVEFQISGSYQYNDDGWTRDRSYVGTHNFSERAFKSIISKKRLPVIKPVKEKELTKEQLDKLDIYLTKNIPKVFIERCEKVGKARVRDTRWEKKFLTVYYTVEMEDVDGYNFYITRWECLTMEELTEIIGEICLIEE